MEFTPGYLTTRYAVDRLFLEILPRLQEKKDNFVNVRPTTRRKGDNVLKGILELHGNAIQKYEQAKQADALAKSPTGSPADFRAKISLAELAFFQEKLGQAKSMLLQLEELQTAEGPESVAKNARITKLKNDVRFFEQKIAVVEYEQRYTAHKRYTPVMFRPAC